MGFFLAWHEQQQARPTVVKLIDKIINIIISFVFSFFNFGGKK